MASTVTTDLALTPNADDSNDKQSIQTVSVPTILANQSTTQQKPPPYISLITNEYFLARLLTLCFTIFLFILSLSYTIGQALSLEFETPFCEKKTADQVAEHSSDNQLNEGDSNGCWSTKRFLKNQDLLWSTENFIGVPQSIGFTFIAFLLVTLLFAIFFVWYIYQLVIDIKKYRSEELGVNSPATNPKSAILSLSPRVSSAVQKNRCCGFLSSASEKALALYQKVFFTDSGWWIVKKLLTELFEIWVQTTALLYYNGGYTLFGSSRDGEEVVLALKHQYIVLFAAFLSSNCIFCCIIWLFYAFKPLLCHGLVFEVVLYSLDIVFDVFYTLFPLIVVAQSNNTLLTALAALQKDDATAFWATFIPLIFLCWASFSFATKSRKAMKEHYASIFTANSTIQLVSIKPNSVITPTPSTYSSTSWMIAPVTTIKSTVIKRISIVSVALMFGIYGIALISKVSDHFTTAISYCSTVSDDLDRLDLVYNQSGAGYALPSDTQTILTQHNELFVWDLCLFKVYPFGLTSEGDPICECREFKTPNDMSSSPRFAWSVDELSEYFGVSLMDIFVCVLREWHMLQTFRWRKMSTVYKKSNRATPSVNMTQDMFNARKMRVFQITQIPITHVDDAISNWKLLAFLDISESDFVALPDSIMELKNLQYLSIVDSYSFISFPLAVCSMSQIKAIIIESTYITSVPHCVKNLKHLQSLLLTGNPLLEWIPLELFAMSNLLELSGAISKVSLDSLLSYNDLLSVDELDRVFQYNPQHNYWFEYADFCDDMTALPMDSIFWQFVNDSACCVSPCEDVGSSNALVDLLQCRSDKHHDGVCHSTCKNARCGWDGGDCTQLCECELRSLGDGVCDPLCNTTNCSYDGYDCQAAAFDAIQCEASYESHGCPVEWVDDLWCDSLCFNAVECGQDHEDCDVICSKRKKCGGVYNLFRFVAVLESNDDYGSLEEVQMVWFWQSELNPLASVSQIWPTPSAFFNDSDLNNDGLLSMREVIVALHFVWNITKEKALQVDCSECVDDYWA
eukprot:383459_1